MRAYNVLLKCSKRTEIFAVFFSLLVAILTFLPSISFAHEAYVLEPETFEEAYERTGVQAIESLADPDNFRLFLLIGAAATVVLALNFMLRHSGIGRAINLQILHFEKYAPLIIRFALGSAFLASAATGSFLGPEIPLTEFPYPDIVRGALGLLGALFILGLFTEIAAALGLFLFFSSTLYLGTYMFTYANYAGELLALAIFGSRFLSIDARLLGKKQVFGKRLDKDLEALVVRAFYGFALIFAAVSIKLLHPYITIEVVEQYNLTQFGWLFPSDPLLIAFGAALAEITIGFFILFGWETRLTVIVSLFYMTLSLIYFGEAVWPHLILYGVSIALLLNDGGRYTLDNYFDERIATAKPPKPHQVPKRRRFAPVATMRDFLQPH